MSIAEPEIQSSSPPAAAPGPLHTRVAETFLAPGALFSRFGATAPWLDVAVVAGILIAIAGALVPAEAIVEMAREQLRNMPRQPGQPAPDPATMAPFIRLSMIAGGLFYPLLGAVIVGGLLKLLFGAAMGGEASYRQYLGVYTHSALIFALGAVIGLPIIIATGDVLRQLNLALLLPDGDRSSFIWKFLAQFGVFSLWQYAVIAIGVAAVNRGRISAGAAWGGVGGLYLVMALAGALMQRG